MKRLLLILAMLGMGSTAHAYYPLVWTYSQASPNGNAYQYTPYGAFPRYPAGAWVGYGGGYHRATIYRYHGYSEVYWR